MTNNDIVSAAFTIAGLTPDGVPMTASQAVDGLTHLNDMMAEWDHDRIKVGWFAQSSGSQQAPLYSYANSAVKYNLAVRLAAAYGVDPPAFVVRTAEISYQSLLNEAMNGEVKEGQMTHLNGAFHSWDIEQG